LHIFQILCATTPDKIEFLEVPSDSKPGDRVFTEKFQCSPDAELNPKQGVFEEICKNLKISEDGKAVYMGKSNPRKKIHDAQAPLLVEGKDPITVATLHNVKIE
jgi:hypothetical protein